MAYMHDYNKKLPVETSPMHDRRYLQQGDGGDWKMCKELWLVGGRRTLRLISEISWSWCMVNYLFNSRKEIEIKSDTVLDMSLTSNRPVSPFFLEQQLSNGWVTRQPPIYITVRVYDCITGKSSSPVTGPKQSPQPLSCALASLPSLKLWILARPPFS